MRAVIILIAAVSITTSATGQTRSDPVVQGVTPKHVPTASDLDAEKSRAAAEVKQKTWDAKMKAVTSGICKGC
jgi:hypothetical protein